MGAIPSWARVGAKVVCINADWSPKERADNDDVAFPEEGNIYTIREVTTTYWPDGHVDVRVEEIVNPVILWRDGPAEPAFSINRFRPLVTIEDDIEAHFANLLRVPTNQPVDA